MGAETAVLIREVKGGFTIAFSKQRNIWVKPEWMNEEAVRIGREDSSRKDPPNTVMLQWACAFPVEVWGASKAGGQRVLCAEDGKF